MHKRLRPSVNAFTYGVTYLYIPWSKLQQAASIPGFSLNDWGLLSLRFDDHGEKNQKNPYLWAENILHQHKLRDAANGEISLLCLPRVLGMGFKPVTFWLCHDLNGALRVVISEVHNTFKEAHCYLSHHPDLSPIATDDWLEAEKLFHVSPFLPVSGYYRFRFSEKPDSIGVWINYYDEEGEMLLTALTGPREEMTAASVHRAFWRYPLLGIKVIGLIHWQAIKLALRKGIHYIPKPAPPKKDIS